MNAINLNENEVLVLKACRLAIKACTADEFGVVKYVLVDSLDKNQLKGYLSQLKNKGLIAIDDMGSEQENQLHLTHDGADFLLSIASDSEEIENLKDIKYNI